ncbi:MAG: hypothetical protein H6713_23735 [Myxococcales bacterium]|nr:hypothetical protein [Myxococcales bacterium]
MSVAAWRASAGRGHPRRASRGGAWLALALGFAGALGFATAPHRDALRQLYRAPDTGLGEHELNDVDALARAELPRIAACPAPSYRDVQPLLLVARHERGSARVVLYAEDDEHVVDDPRALAAWLSNKMLQRTPEEDDRYCRQGAPLYPRRSPSQLEVIIAADASLPRAALDPALARVAEAAERVEFGVARAAETVYASERGEVVTRAHCVTQWFTLAQWRGALADAGTWGALAESPALRDRRVPCTR